MRVAPLTLALLLACSRKGDAPAEDTGAGETGASGDATRATVSGTITWEVDFDEDAEAASQVDCSYTRQYEGSADWSAPWMCPTCELLFHADIAMLGDWEACYESVSATDPPEEEWLAYQDGLWYRAASGQLAERGASTFDGETWTVAQDVEASALGGGGLTYHIAGTLTVGEEAGDPMHGWAASDRYACGWPKLDPPAYDGDYTGDVGDVLPDGLFPDACGDTVRLHDLGGRYLVVDISAADCGPCRNAAGQESAWLAEMAAEGLDVEMVTLLAPSLSNTAGTPTTEELQAWVETFEIHSPVLADRMWGLSVAARAVGEDFGYPTFVVVAPDLTIIENHVGFSDFDDIAQTIRAHAAGR